MKWRPISSVRFPDTIGLGDDILVYDEAYGIVVAAPETARKGERRIWAHGHKLTMATHWQPLPEAPKHETQDDQ